MALLDNDKKSGRLLLCWDEDDEGEGGMVLRTRDEGAAAANAVND